MTCSGEAVSGEVEGFRREGLGCAEGQQEDGHEARAREATGRLALALAGALMLRYAPAALADAFCAARLDPEAGITAQAYGALPSNTALPEIIAYGRAEAG